MKLPGVGKSVRLTKTGSFTFSPSTESFALAIKSPLTAYVRKVRFIINALAALHVC